MKKLLLFLLFIFLNIQLFSQAPWNYNFGTGTGVFNTPSTSSTSFLPTPASGTAFVYIGNAGGAFTLSNPGTSLGTGSELVGTAANGDAKGSINKFSIYNITNPSPAFSLRFSIRLDGGEDLSEWLLYIGDGSDPGFYDNDVPYFSSTIFTGIKWQFTTTTAINTYVNLGSSWTATTSPSWNMVEATDYTFDIFANNTGSSISYTYQGVSQQVAAGSYDIWLNGVLVRHNDSRGGFTGPNISSFAFVGRLSSGNAATIYLDDFSYSNLIENGPLPVELTSFTSSIIGNSVNLKWETATEVNNYGFDVERSSENSGWQKIGFVAGSGNSNSPKDYSFTDNPSGGTTFSYRLKQIDVNGTSKYYDAITINLSNASSEPQLLQNSPNPFNPSTIIKFYIPNTSDVTIRVYDMLGREVTTLINKQTTGGYHNVYWNGKDSKGENVASGVYLYRLTAGSFSETRKMNLLK